MENYEYNYAESELSPLRKEIESLLFLPRYMQFKMINKKLDDFYKNNNIGKKDIDIKNHMRHMGGSALMASPYWLGGRKTSKFWGDAKEGFDIAIGKKDTDIDLQNNQIGRNIAKANPGLKTDELLQKVYEEVLRRYKN